MRSRRIEYSGNCRGEASILCIRPLPRNARNGRQPDWREALERSRDRQKVKINNQQINNT